MRQAWHFLAIGRPKEAEELLIKKTKMQIEYKDWENASAGYHNLADLQFRMGELGSALNCAEEALKMAEKAKSDVDIVKSKAYLGQILYLLGKNREAEEQFKRADEYADFLISEKQN
jgi:tetratricopeptide (TPR) repeat protein